MDLWFNPKSAQGGPHPIHPRLQGREGTQGHDSRLCQRPVGGMRQRGRDTAGLTPQPGWRQAGMEGVTACAMGEGTGCVRRAHWFPSAAVTKPHRLEAHDNRNVSAHSSGAWSLKPSCQQDHPPSENCRGESFPYLLVSGVCGQSSAFGLRGLQTHHSGPRLRIPGLSARASS